jgi:16S rRNA (uracil1498-N3)-methyltransferase
VNLLLIEPSELGEDSTVVLRGRRADHLNRVLRVRPGMRLRVGVLGAAAGRGEVRAVGPQAVTLAIELGDGGAPPRPAVDLILAVPRPKVLARALQTAAAFGVGRIDLINAWRVEKSYFQSPQLAADALRAQLIGGCEQGGTTWVPEVAVHRLLMPYLDGMPPPAGETRLLLHPHAAADLADQAAPGFAGRAVAAIGPEGGWIDRELSSLADRGFRPVCLGQRVLRVETALAALLAQLELLRGLPGS